MIDTASPLSTDNFTAPTTEKGESKVHTKFTRHFPLFITCTRIPPFQINPPQPTLKHKILKFISIYKRLYTKLHTCFYNGHTQTPIYTYIQIGDPPYVKAAAAV